MSAMAKTRGRPKNVEPTVAFQLRIPESLYQAFADLVADSRRTLNAEAQLALEAYAKAKKVWPRKPNPPEPPS